MRTGKNYGTGNGLQFQELTKACPQYARECAALTPRKAANHYGPLTEGTAAVGRELRLQNTRPAVHRVGVSEIIGVDVIAGVRATSILSAAAISAPRATSSTASRALGRRPGKIAPHGHGAFDEAANRASKPNPHQGAIRSRDMSAYERVEMLEEQNADD
jgi:hypothetical protein